MVTPYTRCKDDDLSTEMVINILKDSEEAGKSVCHLPPVNPKGGDVFLFLTRDKDSKGNYEGSMSSIISSHFNYLVLL